MRRCKYRRHRRRRLSIPKDFLVKPGDPCYFKRYIFMATIEKLLVIWQGSLCRSLSLRELYSRNPTVYKWKAPFRSMRLRESILWRTHDLLSQAHFLFKSDHILGSRILFRSALESTAVLIYLNQITERVLSGELDFHDFSVKTSRLLLGSKNKTTNHESINIITILEKSEKNYAGLSRIFATLSECVHPNFEGVCFGYSQTDFETYESNFANYWKEMWADRHEEIFRLIYGVTQREYSKVWPPLFERLEEWISINDFCLE